MQKVKNFNSLKEEIKRKLPPSSYEVIHLPSIKITKKAKCYKEDVGKRQKFTASTTSRAENFRLKLDAKYPSFSKSLQKSNVSGSFWLGIAHSFCQKHLPQIDTYFILENEDGKQYKTKLLGKKMAFSGGWRGFSLSENLSKGDVLVFQLVSLDKFKVYRFRDSESNDVSGARIAPNAGTQVNQSATTEPGSTFEEENVKIQHASSCGGISRKGDPDVPNVEQTPSAVSLDGDLEEPNIEMHQNSSPPAVSQDEDHDVLSDDDYETMQEAKDSESNGPNFPYSNLENRQFPSSVAVDCFSFRTINDFVTEIDNLLKNHYDLPRHMKWSYYRLCLSQNALLHSGILKGSHPLTVAGCIIDIIDIANAMRSCELSTFQSQYSIWREKLNYLKACGMKVTFLCDRLHHLQTIVFNPEAAKNVQHYKDLSSTLADTGNKVKSLKDQLSELTRVLESQADEKKKLKAVIDKHELVFQDQEKCYEEDGGKRQKFTVSVTSRSEEFRLKLDANYPSFSKALTKSNVSGSFWMGIPHSFCRKHLPLIDTNFILENEDRKQYRTKFLAFKMAFSGGWKGFSESENLSTGDVIVFQLVSSDKFKVYQFRDIDPNDVDGARFAPNVGTQFNKNATTEPDSTSKEENAEIQHTFSSRGISRNGDLEVPNVEQNVGKHQAAALSVVSQDGDPELLSEEDCGTMQEATDAENNDPGSHFENPEHWQFAPSVAADCCSFGTIDDFIVEIDKLLKNQYDLPFYIKWSYWNLCSSQNAFLHTGISKGIPPISVAGCIIDTVDIANAMRSCGISTCQNEYAVWDAKVNYLKACGMKVAFLCDRLHHLQTIAFNPEAAKNVQHLRDLRSKHTDTANTINSLKDKLSELMKVSEREVDDMKKLKAVIDKHGLVFQEQVSAPW